MLMLEWYVHTLALLVKAAYCMCMYRSRRTSKMVGILSFRKYISTIKYHCLSVPSKLSEPRCVHSQPISSYPIRIGLHPHVLTCCFIYFSQSLSHYFLIFITTLTSECISLEFCFATGLRYMLVYVCALWTVSHIY